MTPLERLGLEVAAARLLGHRGHAALLCALIDGVTGWEALAEVRRSNYPRDEPNPFQVSKRVNYLRRAMDDVGLTDVIRTVRTLGYALPEPGRSQVIARLVEEAGA